MKGLVEDLLARQGRLLSVEAALAALPTAGDHVLNASIWPGDARPWRDAAVLIGIIDDGSDGRLILTQRPVHMNSHSGEIALPGGKVDADDTDPVAAALREAWEEIGLAPEMVRPLGLLSPYFTHSSYRIFPVVALVDDSAAFHPNPSEVALLFDVPFGHVRDFGNHVLKSREWRGVERFYWTMPYAEHYIWGITAGILHHFWEQIYAGDGV